jgi:hypothetical protein
MEARKIFRLTESGTQTIWVDLQNVYLFSGVYGLFRTPFFYQMRRTKTPQVFKEFLY